jgi:Raf kinase inhibitor-like YbhB/YbcL family protein
MKLTSSAFLNGEVIPSKYTGEGRNVSPPLEWTDVPKGCKSFALICEDPDAPGQENPFVHWLIYNINDKVTSLPENLIKMGEITYPFEATQGTNSFGEIGYGGPMPPPGDGPHRYVFLLYALDSVEFLPPGTDKLTLQKHIETRALATAELIGVYERAIDRRVVAW